MDVIFTNKALKNINQITTYISEQGYLKKRWNMPKNYMISAIHYVFIQINIIFADLRNLREEILGVQYFKIISLLIKLARRI